MNRSVLQKIPKSGTVAVIRALQLGDMLCAVPALRSLRTFRPDCRITLIGLPWADWFAHRFSHLIDDFQEFPGFRGIPERDWDAERFERFVKSVSERPFDLV